MRRSDNQYEIYCTQNGAYKVGFSKVLQSIMHVMYVLYQGTSYFRSTTQHECTAATLIDLRSFCSRVQYEDMRAMYHVG